MATTPAEDCETSGLSEVGGYYEEKHYHAEIIFAVIAFIFSVILLSLISNQTTWVNGQPFTKQPAFWPAISLIGMVVAGAFELFFIWRRFKVLGGKKCSDEMFRWFKAVEFLIWFMVYVFAVPYLGYLLATLIFTVSLTYRLGYRGKFYMLMAALSGLGVVLLFKTMLSVKVPSGVIYEYLPDALRNFMILYF